MYQLSHQCISSNQIALSFAFSAVPSHISAATAQHLHGGGTTGAFRGVSVISALSSLNSAAIK